MQVTPSHNEGGELVREEVETEWREHEKAWQEAGRVGVGLEI